MIFDQLSHAETYYRFGNSFPEAFDYLKNFSQDTADGRYEIGGNGIYSLVQSYEATPSTERTFESHQLYLDIHYILTGHEITFYADLAALHPKDAYDCEKDAIYYEGPENRPLHISSGEFVVLLPQDGHKPGCLWEPSCFVRKVVMKVPLSSL